MTVSSPWSQLALAHVRLPDAGGLMLRGGGVADQRIDSGFPRHGRTLVSRSLPATAASIADSLECPSAPDARSCHQASPGAAITSKRLVLPNAAGHGCPLQKLSENTRDLLYDADNSKYAQHCAHRLSDRSYLFRELLSDIH